MLISIGLYMFLYIYIQQIKVTSHNKFKIKILTNICLMLCAPLDWQYAELPSSASDSVL